MSGQQHGKKHPDHFQIALVVVFLSILLPSIAFISENKNSVGLAADSLGVYISPYSDEQQAMSVFGLKEFDDFNELSSLAQGYYYIDSNAFVYWISDGSQILVAHVKNTGYSQTSKKLYIDDDGNIRYVVS